MKLIPKFDNGGITLLPNIIVTKRGSYPQYTGEETYKPSYDEFRDAKIQEAKVNAINKMLSLNEPILPKVPRKTGRWFRHIFGDWFDDNDAGFIFGYEKDPNSCIYTSTSAYEHPVKRNSEFAENPYKFGFQLIPNNLVQEGDLILLYNNKNIPHHMMTVTGFDIKQRPVLTYPRGLKKDGYVKDNDTFWDNNKEDYKTYRFIGNSEDEKNWAKLYNILYK